VGEPKDRTVLEPSATTSTLVFFGFLFTTLTTVIGLIWAARQGSWALAGTCTTFGIGSLILLARTIVSRVDFAWTYMPGAIAVWLMTTAVASGAGAAFVLLYDDRTHRRSFIEGLAVAAVVWLPLAVLSAGISACNFDAGCY
jgi:hypothetical protein